MPTEICFVRPHSYTTRASALTDGNVRSTHQEAEKHLRKPKARLTILLDGYRHEFGSIISVGNHERLLTLPEDLRELAMHLIASHHGFGRPFIETGGCDAAPPSGLERYAKEIALRFERLQRAWGPWGLAWWESLLRAADQQASRENDERASEPLGIAKSA